MTVDQLETIKTDEQAQTALEEIKKFVKMEFCDVGDFEGYVKDKNFGFETKLKLMAQCSLALEYMHENNIGHRDLKPDNILIKKNTTDETCSFSKQSTCRILLVGTVGAGKSSFINSLASSFIPKSREPNLENITYVKIEDIDRNCVSDSNTTEKFLKDFDYGIHCVVIIANVKSKIEYQEKMVEIMHHVRKDIPMVVLLTKLDMVISGNKLHKDIKEEARPNPAMPPVKYSSECEPHRADVWAAAYILSEMLHTCTFKQIGGLLEEVSSKLLSDEISKNFISALGVVSSGRLGMIGHTFDFMALPIIVTISSDSINAPKAPIIYPGPWHERGVNFNVENQQNVPNSNRTDTREDLRPKQEEFFIPIWQTICVSIARLGNHVLGLAVALAGSHVLARHSLLPIHACLIFLLITQLYTEKVYTFFHVNSHEDIRRNYPGTVTRARRYLTPVMLLQFQLVVFILTQYQEMHVANKQINEVFLFLLHSFLTFHSVLHFICHVTDYVSFIM